MEFRVLGDLEVLAGGSPLVVGLHSDQKVLGLLLVSAGRVVAVPRLVDALWEDGPPATAVKQVRNAVSRLRRLLSGAGAPGLIHTRGGGYVITLAGAVLDLAEFEAKAAQAEAAVSAGRQHEAAGLFRGALDLWRGPLLSGLDGSIFRDMAAAWEERRCAVAESYYDQQLALGRQHEAVAGLAEHVREHPLREKPVGQLMVALYRCGRQADALALYGDTRETLAAELGLDPGPELQRLHQQVLTADPALATPQAGNDERRSNASRPAAVPRQLPGAVRHFTGRQEELKALSELLRQVDATAETVVISAIDGTAGVGKTALAVHWAHQVADRFPDGQLYVNLRGFDPARPPVDAAEAIRGFLDAYEIPAARIPVSPEAQSGLYRSVMAGKRALIVLDNARDAAQVRPLLPGSPGCFVLVTSRNQLTGLTVAHGAQPITVGLFTGEEARAYLAHRLGPERVEAEPQAAGLLIDLCARLPLALSIVAARALRQPSLSLAALAAQLQDVARRLDELDSGDAATGVRPVLSWSYRTLTGEAARMFRLLALHPGPDISVPAATSLAGVPPARTRAALAELTRAHLLTEHTPGRFTFHDLLRAHAGEQAQAVDSAVERRTATHRMLDHYLHTSYAAARLLRPGREAISLEPAVPGAVPEEHGDQAEARTWFAAECRVLLAVVGQAAEERFDTHAWQISWALATPREMLFLHRDQIAAHRTALAAARRCGDLAGQAWAHRLLANVYIALGVYDEAGANLRDALRLNEQRCDRAGLGRVHLDLGRILAEQGHYQQALRHVQQALSVFIAIGHRGGQAAALNDAAWCQAHMSNLRQAVASGERALELERELGNRGSEADTLDTLGFAHLNDGRFGQAVEYYQRAIDLYRELGERYDEADTLTHLGDAYHGAEDLRPARASWETALAIFDELEHPEAEEVRSRLHNLRC